MTQQTQTLTAYEKETIINFNEDEKTASVYTYNKVMTKKLDECCLKYPELFKIEKENIYGRHLSKTYTIPKKYVSIRKPKFLTEAQKILAKDKARKMRGIRSLNY